MKVVPMVMLVLGLVSISMRMQKEDTGLLLKVLETLLAGYCMVAFVWASTNKHYSVMVIRVVIAVYMIFSFLYAVGFNKANLSDFLMIYKSFFYLFIISFLVDKRLMEARYVLKFFNLLLLIFFVKYLSSILLNITNRPVVYEENNFELMLLYALYLVRYSITKKWKIQYLAFIGLITVLSLSRASLVMYAVLALYVVYQSYRKTWVFIIPFALVVLGGGIFYIFSQRSGSLEEIDRYRFFLIFLEEVKDWNAIQWLVGNGRITRLSYNSCDMMRDYGNLFSFAGDGTCYSVVLHSFLLRVILDHGLIGFAFIVYCTYVFLIKSGMDWLQTWVFIAIVILNGLSVSSFNNLFFALSMLFLMTTNRFRKGIETQPVIRLPWAAPSLR